MVCQREAVNIQQDDLTVRIAINIFQIQSFYYPLPYIIALRVTKLTVPLNMELESLRPLAYCNYGFESRRRYGCLSLHSVVCCQICDDPITQPDEPYEVWCVSMGVVEEPLGGSLGPQGLPSHDKNIDLEKFLTAVLTATQLPLTTVYCCHIWSPS
jgi:hypothetical protein